MKYIKSIFLIIIFGVFFTSCSNSNNKDRENNYMEEEIIEDNLNVEDSGESEYMQKNSQGFYEISQEKAKEMIDNKDVYIIDVRELNEYNDGHIENSILVPVGEVTRKIEDVVEDKNSTILVYCRSGRRSKVASLHMVSLGYENVYEFGGISTWKYGIVK